MVEQWTVRALSADVSALVRVDAFPESESTDAYRGGLMARLTLTLATVAKLSQPPMSNPQALTDGDLTGKIINAFYAAYDELGYGFLESVYSAAMAYELERRGLKFTREASVDVYYRGFKVGHFRTDIVVEGRVLVEIKASRSIDESDRRQILNYLRATNLEVALLLHFGPKANFLRLIFENTRKRSLTVVSPN